MGEELYRFKGFYLNVTRKRLSEDRDISLSDLQFETLRLLVENRGRKLGKEYLALKVCPTSENGRNAIERAITALREKLNDSRYRPEIIRTEDLGYSFIADVTKVWVVDEDERAEARPAEEQAAAPAAVAETPAAEVTPVADAAPPSPEELKDQEIGFHELWLSAGRRIRWVVGLGILLTAAISCLMVYREWRNINVGVAAPPGQVEGALKAEEAQAAQNASVANAQNAVLAWASAPQLGMLLLAIWYGLRGPDRLDENFWKDAGYENPEEGDDARHIAEDALWRHKLYWWGILAFWACLYCSLVVFINIGTDVSPWRDILTTTFNNLSTAMFFLSYNILNQPVEIKKGYRKIDDSQWVVSSTVLVVAFALIEIIPWRLSQAEIDMERLLYACSLVSGVVGAVGMALYMGRLQSKFLGPSPGLVIALYSYTAIQPLFIFLVNVPKSKQVFDAAAVTIIAVALVNVALILKCMLFLYVTQLVRSGGLLFYFVKVRRTYLNVTPERQQFRKFLKWER
jgi:DNA-binding winged helix-turn-helix (wHTH) protein